MAGDWLPIRLDLHDDPAVIAIAGELGIDEHAVVGRLVKLWSWANRHLENGDARCVTEVWVDRYLATAGFAAAMLHAGWLRTRSGGIEFPNFDRWNSKGAKARLLTAKRMRKTRDAESDGASVTKTSPQERRGEKRKKKDPPTPLPGDAGPERPPAAMRPRNLLFDAIIDVTGADPKDDGGRVGSAAAELAGYDPPFTPQDVRAFASRYWEICPWAADRQQKWPTVGEVKKYIHRLRADPTPKQQPPPKPGGYRTSDERLGESLFRVIEDAGALANRAIAAPGGERVRSADGVADP